MSKGSNRRPQLVDDKKVQERWNKIFNRGEKKEEPQQEQKAEDDSNKD